MKILISITVLTAIVCAETQAANPKREASRKLDRVTRSVLKTFKQGVNAHRGVLFAEIKAVEALAGNTSSFGAGNQLFDALTAFQKDVMTELNTARNNMFSELRDALIILEDAGIPRHEFPKGFTHGDGGAKDRFRQEMDSFLRRSYAAIGKRLRKAGMELQRKAEIGLTFRLEVPTEFLERMGNKTGSEPVYIPKYHGVDVLLATSSLRVTGDGILWIGGSGNAGDGTHTLSSTFTSSSPITVSNDRWDRYYSGLDEKNHQFRFYRPGILGGSPIIGIGIR